ncbi:MFS transporter [Niabella yanshanensis]|uniref:MFS transporter n=1 Tax=Niabella yanshanensis TaxID=577386 RepID=A0ABZ0W086_9BACT|nr:MFS transporter [Niabella yanshanensis]WQD36663.1 MFS transporter [Niabella yanshanensis]
MKTRKFFNLYVDSYRGLSTPAWMLALVMLINRTGAMVLPFMAIYMRDHLHFSLEEAGIVLSFFGLGSLLGNIAGGWLTDKFGSFKVQCLSLFLAAPLYILIGKFHTVEALSAGIFTLSFIADLFRPANSAAITSYAKPENLTRAFSLNRMAINLGFSFGPFLGGLLAAISYDLLFWGNAIGCFIAAILFYSYFNNRKAQKAKAAVRIVTAENSKQQASAYRDRPYLLFAFICMLYFIPFCQLLNAMPLFFDEKAGMSKEAIGTLMGYSGFIIVLTEMVIVSIVQNRFSIYNSIILGTLFIIPGFVIYLLTTELWALYLAISLISLSEILVLPFTSTVGALRAGANNKGSYMALNSLGFSMAFIITPFLSTKIIESYGYYYLWLTDVLFIAAALAGFIMIKKMMPLKEYRISKESNKEPVLEEAC